MSLKISKSLELPREAATWVLGFLAKRGAGKTYAANTKEAIDKLLRWEILTRAKDGRLVLHTERIQIVEASPILGVQ